MSELAEFQRQFSWTLPAVMAKWMAGDDLARAICTSDRTTLWWNEQFERQVEGSAILRFSRERLAGATKEVEGKLAALFSPMLAGEADAFFSHHGEHATETVAARVRLLADEDRVLFGLTLRITVRDDDIRFSGIAEHFGFTRSEDVICQAMLSGQNARQIADSQGLSHETVRFHIKNIYRKASVRSKEELFYRLQRFRCW